MMSGLEAWFALSPHRPPARVPQNNFMMSVIMVFISCLGFFIDPSATPARVTLGIVSLLVVLQNYIALTSNSARDISTTWLGRFILGSLFFNLCAFGEQSMPVQGSNPRLADDTGQPAPHATGPHISGQSSSTSACRRASGSRRSVPSSPRCRNGTTRYIRTSTRCANFLRSGTTTETALSRCSPQTTASTGTCTYDATELAS